MKKIVLYILFLISIFQTSAVNYAEYTFQNEDSLSVEGVLVKGYICQTTDCNPIQNELFGGTILSSNTNLPFYKVIIEYPSTQQGNYYVLHLFHEDYKSKYAIFGAVGYTDINNPGTSLENPWVYPTPITFNKQDACSSPVSLSVVNNIKENLPLVISSDANLDATTVSGIGFTYNVNIPIELREYYEVETTLYLTIHEWDENTQQNIGSPVEEQTEVERIYYDDTINVQFQDWTPPAKGHYNVTVTTTVTDGKCSSNIPASSSSLVRVWEDYPRDECYSLVNSLTTDPMQPEINQDTLLTFDKLSNYANDYDAWDPNYQLTPVGSNVILNIVGDAQSTQTISLLANQDENFEQHSVTWKPDKYGTFTLQILVESDDPVCIGKEDTADSMTTTFSIIPPPDRDLTITVIDQNQNTVNNAAISLVNEITSDQYTGLTNSNGRDTITAPMGNYTYTISKIDYATATGNVEIDRTKSVILPIIASTLCPGVDTSTNISNCGQCGNECYFDHGDYECSSGVCVMNSCNNNYYDLDNNLENGCEYNCVKTENSEQNCKDDEDDDDCDGLLDCQDPDCWSIIDELTGINPCSCDETNNGVEICDNLDNDCNGVKEALQAMTPEWSIEI